MISNQIDKARFLQNVESDIFKGTLGALAGLGSTSPEELWRSAQLTGGVDILIEISKSIKAGKYDAPEPVVAPHAAEIAEETANILESLRVYFDDRTPKTYSQRVMALDDVRRAFERLASYESPNTTAESVERYRTQLPTFPNEVTFDEAPEDVGALNAAAAKADRDLPWCSEGFDEPYRAEAADSDEDDRYDDDEDFDSDDGDDEDDDRGEDSEEWRCGSDFDSDYDDEDAGYAGNAVRGSN